MSLSRRQRLRRVGILCCHILRNLAYHRAWFEKGKPGADSQFWVSVNGNFADVTVLEWCKALADVRGKHHWSKVVRDKVAFEARLLQQLGKDAAEWETHIKDMRLLRDKFIAHLDDELEMTLPVMDLAKASTIYLYDYLLANENEGGVFHDAPPSAEDWFEKLSAEAKAVYEA